jgi:hypothetical protein
MILMLITLAAQFLGLNPSPYRELYAAADAANSSNAALDGDGVDFAIGSAGVFDTILAFTKTGD